MQFSRTHVSLCTSEYCQKEDLKNQPKLKLSELHLIRNPKGSQTHFSLTFKDLLCQVENRCIMITVLLQVHIKIVLQTNLAGAYVINLKKLSYPPSACSKFCPHLSSLPRTSTALHLLHNGERQSFLI